MEAAWVTETLPTEVDIQNALQWSGYCPINSAVKQFKVGGIGKGYAADKVISLLKEHSITIALVDIEGDITLGNLSTK